LERQIRSSPLTATTNSRVVTSGKDATGHVTDYYDIIQNIVEYTIGGATELKVVFSQCNLFDPINDTRVDDFGMVEVKHESCYSGSNLLLAHQAQQLYYLSYPHPSLKNLWFVYKVNSEMHTHWYDEYIERHEDDDIYQEEIKVDQNFMVTDEAGLAELDTDDAELLDEEADRSKKSFKNQSVFLKDKKDVNDLMHMSQKQILILMIFHM
jgi:hypothetical protein